VKTPYIMAELMVRFGFKKAFKGKSEQKSQNKSWIWSWKYIEGNVKYDGWQSLSDTCN